MFQKATSTYIYICGKSHKKLHQEEEEENEKKNTAADYVVLLNIVPLVYDFSNTHHIQSSTERNVQICT